MLVTMMCHISNERVFFSLSYDVNDIFISHAKVEEVIQNLFFHFYFLNMDISLNIWATKTKFEGHVKNIQKE